MEKEEQKKDKKIGKRFKIGLIITICVDLILLIALYVTFIVTHKDEGRNKHQPNCFTTTQVIESNLVEAFKDTKTTGKFSFRLSDDDINQIIAKSGVSLPWKKALNFYYEGQNEENHFYADFKTTLGVITRADYSFSFSGFTSSNQKVFSLTNKTMGKLPYLKRISGLNDFFSDLKTKSGLPFEFTDKNELVTTPYALIEYFPNENVKSYLKEIVSMKPECLEIANDQSLFGFDINFSLLNNNSLISKEISEELEEDIHERVRSSITYDFLNSISDGESFVAESLQVKEINKMMSLVSEYQSERVTASVNDRLLIFGVADVFMVIKDENKVDFVFNYLFNGYTVQFIYACTLFNVGDEFLISIRLGNELTLGDQELTNSSVIQSILIEELKQTLTSLDEEYSYIEYNKLNGVLSFDFTDIGNDIPIFNDYSHYIDVVNAVPQAFNFVVSK